MAEENKLSPFEAARANIKRTAENFNMYNSIKMLVTVLDEIDILDEQARESAEKMFLNVIHEMSLYLEERGNQWN